MEDVGRIYLDTNIFIIAFERRDEIGDMLLQSFVAAGRRHAKLFVTSELTLAELLVTPYRNGDTILAETYETSISTNSWLEVLPIERSMFLCTAMLRSQYSGLKLPDALHLSVAAAAGCSHLLTDDYGIKGEYRLAGSRYGLEFDTPPLAVLRPDEPTLSSLLKSLAE
ncbi:type II toxin-antitoxin system VapC family toxin [Rhizobium sp. BR 362]|uniref:type II toxin-antitoxin system VapC family toxin n=1 Tax=Rhizobium sp. BR 362 TaxID=3040670 RepID=UPI002F41A6AB